MRSRSKLFRLQANRQPEESGPPLSREQINELLCNGEVSGGSLVPWGSNYTYYVTLEVGDLRHRAVYKPRKGEAPLIDFPSGTLYLREYAAYLTSDWLGWDLVPQTVIRDGPYGAGTMHIYVDAEGSPHVYSLGPQDLPDLQKLVLFDIIVNNADRKPAHCFKGVGHGLWAIDHGLTFHHRPKLRTVIWDFCGEEIPAEIVRDLQSARCDDARVADLNDRLRPLLAERELEAFWRRLDAVLDRRVYPRLDPRYNIPYGFA